MGPWWGDHLKHVMSDGVKEETDSDGETATTWNILFKWAEKCVTSVV